ncbi:MAG: MarR family winged helix-turn-helix transcriptional regulator [Burkholderiaceae bacterium]
MNSPKLKASSAVFDAAERAHRRLSGSGVGDISIYIQMRMCHQQMNDRLGHLLAPYGLSNLGFFTMMGIVGRDGLANPSELCDALCETRGNMTRICDELVAKGWMRRVPNPEDRRRVDLSLTDSGMKLLGEIAPMARQNAEAFFKRVFSAQERATLQDLLRRFSDALSEG